MKFDIKKISSVLASVAMLGATAGIAAAAAYPSTFTANAGSGTAIVVGSTGAQSDFAAATDIGANLNSVITASSVTGGTVTTSGESVALFGGTKIYLNDSLNKVKSTLTKSNLPNVLADSTLSGNVESGITHKIVIGSNPIVSFAKQPTGDEDPVVGLALSTAASDYIYNMSIIFDTAVDFTDSDTEGESLILFGEKFTISSATTLNKIVLLKSSQSFTLSIGGGSPNPVQTVTIDGETYTVELVAGSDGDATIRVTDSSGASDSKTINEAASKKIKGLEVAVTSADESSLESVGITAEVSVGANRITLANGAEVTVTSSNTAIDNTNVGINNISAATRISIEVAAQDDDKDSITPGNSFVDPVFGAFKIDFAGLNIANDDPSREEIAIKNTGAKGMVVSFSDYNGDSISSFQWAYNGTDASGNLAKNRDDLIHVLEHEAINKSEYVMVGNEDNGGLFQVTTITNSSGEFKLAMKDVFTLDTITVTDSAHEMTGIITLKGVDYTYTYVNNAGTGATRQIRLNYPGSSGNDIIMFPTIETSKGANFAFYVPTTVKLSNFSGNSTSSVTSLKFPNGEGYTSFTTALGGGDALGTNWTFSTGGANLSTGVGAGVDSLTGTVGQLTYNFTSTGSVNETKVYLQTTSGVNIVRPAIVLFEEKDDVLSEYNAVIVTLDAGYDGDSAGLGIADTDRTWDSDTLWDDIQLESDNDLYTEMTLWGTLINTDKGDSDQITTVISYPDEQVYAQIYFSAADATVTAGDGSGGSIVPVYDTENVAGKNLIVVGGSCVNTVAAELLGSSAPLCGPDFTATTGVGAGEFLIETFARTGSKIATLVAGYNAADTTSASAALISQKPSIDAGTKLKGDSSGTLTPI